MAKKLNKVFLNPTAEQIAEYQLIEGVSWFTDMDLLADAIEKDQKQKTPQQIYTLKNFQIVDGARNLTAKLTKIGAATIKNGFTLSNDLSKVLDWTQTEIDYDVDHVVDHRVASTAADGAADLSDFKEVNASVAIARKDYPTDDPGAANKKGEDEYDKAIADQKKAYDDANVNSDTKVIGYKDLTLTNIGSKADYDEEGVTINTRKTTVSQYKPIDVEAGDFSFDYQYDADVTVDKKDPFLVVEAGKESASISGAASGSLSVKDSVIGSITPAFSESADEIKGLQNRDEVNDLVATLNKDAGAYETVTIDNSTVTGNIQGGAVSYDKTRTGKEETFLDKPEESGFYYNAVSAKTNLGVTSDNNKLFIAASSNVSALTESEAKALENKDYTVTKDSSKKNTEVNKYEIVTYDINGDAQKTGTFVYLSGDEYNNLSGASKKALNNGVGVEANVGWVDYDPKRVVTDANFQTFTTAPTGAAAANKVANRVNKYVWEKAGVPITYYLTADEAKIDQAGGIDEYLVGEGYSQVKGDWVTDESFRRIAEDGTVNKTNMDALAKTAYNTNSSAYQRYTVTVSMDEDAALELNKTDMPNGFAWIKGGAVDKDHKALFRMSKFTKEGGNSVETKYYLTASEMSAMGFFGKDGEGKNIVKNYNEVLDLAYTGLTKEGWAFTDNVENTALEKEKRLYKNDEDKQMYREGVPATEKELAHYTTDKTDVVTGDVPNIYTRYELSYTATPGANRLDTKMTALGAGDQFNTLASNDLVGKGGEFVTVIDGQAFDQYQIYGYGDIVNAPEVTVTTEKLTLNAAEIKYDGVVQEALWDGDTRIAKKKATLVDGVKTQNTSKYFDPYASNKGEYIIDTKATGEKTHDFITVAEKRERGNNIDINVTATTAEVVTDEVQAKIKDGDKYVAAYIKREDGTLTKETEAATANLEVKYYKCDDGNIYALTGDLGSGEVKLVNDVGTLWDPITGSAPVYYYYSATAGKGGWFDTVEHANANIGASPVTDAKKSTTQPPARRDYQVAEITGPVSTTADLVSVKYTTLLAADQLTTETKWQYQKAYVTEVYNTVKDAGNDYDARVQKDGKDAFIETLTGTLVTDATTTYEAIYEYQLKKGGVSVDGLTYYMTVAEAAKAKNSDDYGTGTEFVQGAAYVDGGKYQYRISNLGKDGSGLDKSAYLSKSTDGNVTDTTSAPKKTVDNAEAFYRIDYVIGYQVYKYTLEGDSSTYYLTEAEATAAAGWGTLSQGDKVEGSLHYGMAESYDSVYKPNFTKAGTVYYTNPLYSSEPTPIWSITQDAEGNIVQAFNDEGEIWSNIGGTTWDDGKEQFSNYAFEQCENTYFYTYEGDREGANAWTTEQIEQIAAAEAAAGIATWTVQDIDGQIVWTRTSSIGEVSTYVMEHADVVTENNLKDNYAKVATGSISVINGSEVRGTISGYLDVIVSDSSVKDVTGGNKVKTTAETLSTSKGSVGKDGNATITTKETEKSEKTAIGAGSFTISRAASDKIYKGAGNVSGYETVSVSGVDTGALTVESTKSTTDKNWQTSYTGEADALRSDYVEDWDNLAFSNGIVSKITAENKTTKDVSSSMGSVEVTGRDYTFVPGTKQDTANSVFGDISGYNQVSLSNVSLNGGMTAVNKYVFEDTDDTGEQVTYYLTAAERAGAVGAAITAKYETPILPPVPGYFRVAKEVTVADYETEAAAARMSDARDIIANDSTSEEQTSYKLSTKGNVDTATATKKSKEETKALAELTAVNTVTNPEYEADLGIGNITGFASVTTENYSFGDADAVGDVTTTKSTSSARDAVASDMRLINAGVNKDTGLLSETPSQKYAYGQTTAVNWVAGFPKITYSNKDMSWSSDTSTKRTAKATLTASGRAYTKVKENYTEDKDGGKDQVFAYTQTATGRTVYLTEAQFEALQSGSKADAAQWNKDEKTVVYYRDSAQAVNFTGAVKGTQVVYKCDSATPGTTLFLTEAEMANYNLVHAAVPGEILSKSGDAYLRVNAANKVEFDATTLNQVDTASGAVGTVAGVFQWKKAGEENQYLTEAEAAALGEGWSKVDATEYVRKANAADDNRSNTSTIGDGTAIGSLTGNLKIYQNKYDSSLIYVLTEEEAKFMLDATNYLDDYELVTGTGYRAAGNKAGLSETHTTVAIDAANCYKGKIVEAHSYVQLNKYGEIEDQVYVADSEYALMHAAGKALEHFVLDDGTHAPTPGFTPTYKKALTQYQYRKGNYPEITADTAINTLRPAAGNLIEIATAELWGWKLTDEQAAAANIYAENQKSEFVLDAVTEPATDGNTTFGNIYGYKEVTLTGMNGVDIIRVADGGAVAADTETVKQTYKKTIAKGSGKTKGKTTYTETDSNKSSYTWTADGSVTLIDSKVGNIVGYKTVNVSSDKGTVEVGQIARTDLFQSLDKQSSETATKAVTEDTATSFKVTETKQTKTTVSETAAGSVSLIGKRAGEALVLDDSVIYGTVEEATDAAKAAIKAFGNKQVADVVINAWGGVVGYQDVVVENVTISGAGVMFDGGKYSYTSATNRTDVSVTDNDAETVKVMNKINDSSTTTETASGSLTLTNVNYAFEGSFYTAGGKPVASAAEDYTTVNEYVFDGVTYALTPDEQKALLKYGDIKKKSSTESYVGVQRKNDTVTPAITLTGSLEDVVNAKGVNKDTYGQNTVYFAAKAKNGAGTMVDLYISADKANELLNGEITDLDDAGKKYTEATIDTKEFYGNAALDCYKKATFEAGVQVKADVKKYVITTEGGATTYYLTDAEAAVMKNAGTDIAAASNTAAYTRMTTVDKAVTVNGANIAGTVTGYSDENGFYEYRGVVKDTGKSVSYYLSDTEYDTVMKDKEKYVNFGKVSTTKYFRQTAAVASEGDLVNATEAYLCYEVLSYWDGTNPATTVYLTEDEFKQLIAIDGAYDGYVKKADTKYYRAAKSAYTIEDKDTLNAKFTSVNESEEVFKVMDKGTDPQVLGYLTRAEILALRQNNSKFDDYYDVYDGKKFPATTYLRAADDTTSIIEITPFKAGDGYVIAEGADLQPGAFIATATPTAIAGATATGFQTVTLTNAGLGNLIGGSHTTKNSEKLAAKKNSTIATYTETSDKTDTASGSLTATDSFIGDASWYDKVVLTAEKMDNGKYNAGAIEGGKKVTSTKTVSTTKLDVNKGAYGKSAAATLEYTETTKTTETATGSALLSNVTAGNITRYKDVIVSFDEAIGEKAKAKNQVGAIEGGNKTTQTTETSAKVAASSYSEKVTKETIKSGGTVDLTNVYAAGKVSKYLTATITDSEITGKLEGGDWTVTKTEVDVDGDDPMSSIATENTIAATGKATVTASTVGGIEQFKDVVLAGGVHVTKDIIVGGDEDDEPVRGKKTVVCDRVSYAGGKDIYLTAAEFAAFVAVEGSAYQNFETHSRVRSELTAAELADSDWAVATMKGFVDPGSMTANTACYAVFFNNGGKKVVYLTEAEYKVFKTKETSAMIDTVVSVYRQQAALTDAELKNADDAVTTMKHFTAYTDDAVTDAGYGQEGKNATTWIIKTAGNSLTIDEDGAKVDGKVQGYVNVMVSGASSFGEGYFGTEKTDKLTVDASLATFTTQEAGKNPVGFDFGEGKDELVLNGTIGIQAAFKYDEATGTNAWNLETVSGSGTIVCRTEDVKDVEAAFDGVKVIGSDNYDDETALKYQSFDEAGGMQVLGGTLDEWLGFCDGADFFKNDFGAEKTLSFSGVGVKNGDVIAQMTVDGGEHYTVLKDGDKIADGAVVRITHNDVAKNKTSNDYTIAFK